MGSVRGVVHPRRGRLRHTILCHDGEQKKAEVVEKLFFGSFYFLGCESVEKRERERSRYAFRSVSFGAPKVKPDLKILSCTAGGKWISCDSPYLWSIVSIVVSFLLLKMGFQTEQQSIANELSHVFFEVVVKCVKCPKCVRDLVLRINNQVRFPPCIRATTTLQFMPY